MTEAPLQLYSHAPFFSDLLACTACGCRAEAKRVVPGVGPRGAELMFIGRNPGRDEDTLGSPFIGKGGKELDVWLEKLRLDRGKVVITNAVKCHTKGDRPPKTAEMLICTENWLRRELEYFHKVKILFALGNDVTRFILGSDVESTGQLNAYWMNVRLGDRTFTVIPLAHPGYLIRARSHLARMYDHVLPAIVRYLEKEHPWTYAGSQVSTN